MSVGRLPRLIDKGVVTILGRNLARASLMTRFLPSQLRMIRVALR